ncbi:unnamed protein product [Gongylonema pulchrum]|uniref:Uncharacterized protein n=1 Tax=Gongylonema pulchrum TaxID=637853 RepID=A0A183ETI0_9BILA|nr:unnamed protein product [Gongylonema pulchrum]
MIESLLFRPSQDAFGSSGNGVAGDFIRPQSSGVRDNGISNYGIAAPASFTGYGGGALGSGSGQVQSARQTGIETLLSTFLGLWLSLGCLGMA